MCGIAGIYIKNNVQDGFEKHSDIEILTDALLLGIETRGRDATGVVSIGAGSQTPLLEKADVQASQFVHWRSPIAHRSRIIMLHTRLATKGHPSNLDNNHPVKYGSTFVTHNGMISNDDELFAEHKLPRIGQVDTEIIPALLDKYGMDKANLALKELDGSFAIAACDPTNSPDRLLLAKGPANPLEFMETDKVLIWASTKSAIENAWHVLTGKKPAWNEMDSLKYAELLIVNPDGVEKFDFPVMQRPVQYSNHNNRSGSPSMTWNREPCVCGDSKTIHSGPNDDGECLRHNCNCKMYIKNHSEGEHPLMKASKSGKLALIEKGSEDERDYDRGWNQREFAITEDDEEVNVWAICVGCSTPEHVDDMIAMFGYWFCDACANEEDERNCLPAGDEGTFDAAIMATASDLSLKPEYVYWILFETEDSDFDKDPTLVSSYCACDDTYGKHVEALIGKGVSDIDVKVPNGVVL